jgi:hypothetical protein
VQRQYYVSSGCESVAGLLFLLLLACSPRHHGIVSLLDEIDPHEPAGPWRIIAVSSTKTHQSKRSSCEDNQQSMSSSLRYALKPRKGSTILIRLIYGDGLIEGSTVEARLSGVNGIIVKTSAALNGGCVEMRLRCPDNSVRFLDIAHFGIDGRDIPLKSLIAIEAEERWGERAVQRAKSLMAWAADQGVDEARQVLSQRRFSLLRGGDTRDAVVLTGGDTLCLALPLESNATDLQFWISALSVLPESRCTLEVQILRHSRWCDLMSIRCNELDFLRWNKMSERLRGGEHAGELRFVHRGAKKNVVAIGSPILSPSNRYDADKKNLILVDLDTMRSDRLGCYGYRQRATSVKLDSVLHERGFHVFRNTHSPGSWTLPATAKFLTSRYRGVDLGGARPGACSTLAEVLRANGYYCSAFTGGGVLRLSGFERGFHLYFCSEERNRRLGLGKVEDVFPRALEWLRDADVSPFFLFVHTYETHDPYIRDTFCRGLPHGRLGDLTQGESKAVSSTAGQLSSLRLRRACTFRPPMTGA